MSIKCKLIHALLFALVVQTCCTIVGGDDKELDILFELNGTKYLIGYDYVDADMAAKKCSQSGYQLVAIHSEEINLHLKTYLSINVNLTGDLWTAGRLEIDQDTEINNSTDRIRWGESGESEEYADFANYALQDTSRCKKSECDGGFCPPNCGDTPSCSITLLPCTTITPECGPVSTNCSAFRGECSSTCPECEMVSNPTCSVVQGPCTVEKGNCRVTPGSCTTTRPDCTTSRPNCTTVAKPCRSSSVKPICPTASNCYFLEHERCTTTQLPCYTTSKPCTTHTAKCAEEFNSSGEVTGDKCGETTTTCEPPEEICPPPKTTCKPPFGCDPVVCQSPVRICEKPEVHCPNPITTCPDPIIDCDEPTVECDTPTVICPTPEIICTQPGAICNGSDVSCPATVTHCEPPISDCPKPQVICPTPEIVCEDPIPCDQATHAPLTNPTCPPGYEECTDCGETTTPMSRTCTTEVGGCTCVCLGIEVGFKWEKRNCFEKKQFLCQAGK